MSRIAGSDDLPADDRALLDHDLDLAADRVETNGLDPGQRAVGIGGDELAAGGTL